MTDKQDKIVASRRSFMKLLGAGAVTGGAAAAMAPATAEAAEPVKDGAGYRETEHVRRYYELAKF